MSRLTIAELKNMRESEDHVEFKKGEHGNVSYNGTGMCPTTGQTSSSQRTAAAAFSDM